MTMTQTNQFEFTAVPVATENSLYPGLSLQLSGMASNTTVLGAPVLPNVVASGVSVDSTVQFIRANCDDLFKRLAD
jgi:hypothetical protein